MSDFAPAIKEEKGSRVQWQQNKIQPAAELNIGTPLVSSHTPSIAPSSAANLPIAPAASNFDLQMKCEECEEEEKLQMKPESGSIMMAVGDREEDDPDDLPVQAKLEIGEPDDEYEQEADAVADRVMRMPNPGKMVQKKCEDCDKEEEMVQMKSENGQQQESDSLASQLNNNNGGGSSLPSGPNQFMSNAFGTDFSGVKIHTDSQAVQMNRHLGAKAFAHGNDIYFNQGQYNPNNSQGKHLLAHELTHVIQQNGSKDLISCAYYDIGSQRISVDYSSIISFDSDAQRESQIQTQYSTWNGSSLSASVQTSLHALSQPQTRWVLFGLDLLIDNPQPALNKQQSIQRIIAYAPQALHIPLSARSFRFEEEVLRVSGWHEVTFTESLTPPSVTRAGLYSRLFYNRGSSTGSTGSTCPAPRPATDHLDEPVMRAQLLPLVRTYLGTQALAVSGSTIASGNITDIRSIADIIQQEALSFFSPYMGRGRTRDFLSNWQYSSNLQPSTAPGAIAPDVREAFLTNRTDLVASRANLWSTVNFDPRCTGDQNVFDSIVQQLLTEGPVITNLNTILSWQSFTDHGNTSAEVTINLQYNNANINDCRARWKHIETLSHELIHAYVDQGFYDLHSGRKIIKEGFTEILGDQLYDHLQTRADADAAYRARLETGLSSGACTGVAIPSSVRGYRPDSDNADRIRDLEGDDNFRAAYFMGQIDLVGLQPKLETGAIDSPEERQAEAVADRIMRIPDLGGAVQMSVIGTQGKGMRMVATFGGQKC